MVDVAASKGAGDRIAVRSVTSVAAPAAATPVRAVAPQPDVARLSGVAAQLAGSPPVDVDRVAEIKRAVENGTFPILPATIADTLLALRYDWMSRDAE